MKAEKDEGFGRDVFNSQLGDPGNESDDDKDDDIADWEADEDTYGWDLWLSDFD